MKIKKAIPPVLAITLLIVMVAWMAGNFTDKVEPGTTLITPEGQSDAVAVIREDIPLVEPVPATVEAKQATIISSRILSRIEEIHVRSGDSVEKGQLLVSLEKEDLQSRVSQSEAQINSAQARLLEAEQSLMRAQELRQSGVLAAADLEKAQANRDVMAADLNSAQQALREAETAISFADIVSPITGRVVDRFAEPGDTAQAGMQLLSLYDPVSLRIEANVREQIALGLTLGQKLEVSIPSMSMTLASEIEEMVPAGNVGSRSFSVKSRLEYSEGLLPGMYARLHVPSGTQSVLLAPKDRVAMIGQLDVVWVSVDGKVERRFIRTGKLFDEALVEVISGLDEGDLLLSIPTQ